MRLMLQEQMLSQDQIASLLSSKVGVVLFSSAHDFSVLFENKLLHKQNFILLGNKKQYDLKQFFNYDINKIISLCCQEVSDLLLEFARQFDELIVLVNLNVLDVCYSPTSAFQQAGGLSTKELFYFLTRLKILSNQKSFYVYNYDLSKDSGQVSKLFLEKFQLEFSH